MEAREDREKLTEPVLFLREYENALVVLDELHRVSELFRSLRGIKKRVEDSEAVISGENEDRGRHSGTGNHGKGTTLQGV